MSQFKQCIFSNIVKATVGGLGSWLVVMSMGGCRDANSRTAWDNSPRINHYHNEANKQSADDAVSQFKDFTTGTSGLTPLLQKNLEARRALETTVSDVRLRVFDTELAKLTTNVTWLQLRANLLSSLGMLADEPTKTGADHPLSAANQPIDVNDPGNLDSLAEVVKRYDPELARKIAQRQMRLATAVKMLHVLEAAQEVLLAQARQDVDKANTDLDALNSAATKPAAAGIDDAKDRCARIRWVNALFKQLGGIGQQLRDGQAARRQATELQLRLLVAVDESRDPASAYALASVVGTGLDSDSFALLDEYIEYLSGQPDSPGVTPAAAPLDTLVIQLDSLPSLIEDNGVEINSSWVALKAAAHDAAESVHLGKISAVQEELDILKKLAFNRSTHTVSAKSKFTVQAKVSQLANSDSVPEAKVYAARQDELNYVAVSQLQLLRSLVDRRVPADHAGHAMGILSQPPSTLPSTLPSTRRPSVYRQHWDDLKAENESLNPQQGNVPKNGVNIQSKESTSANAIDGQRITWNKLEALQMDVLQDAMKLAKVSDNGSLARAARRLEDGRRSLVTASKKLRISADDLPGKLKKLISKDKDPKNAKLVESGRKVLKNLLSPNPQISQIVEEGLNTLCPETPANSPAPSASAAAKTKAAAADVAKDTQKAKTQKAIDSAANVIKSFLNDIQNEQDLAAIRVQQFFSELYGVELDLSGENVRHMQQLVVVGDNEIKRWTLLGDLNADYGEAFKETTKDRDEAGDDLKSVTSDLGVKEWNLRNARNALHAVNGKLGALTYELKKAVSQADDALANYEGALPKIKTDAGSVVDFGMWLQISPDLALPFKALQDTKNAVEILRIKAQEVRKEQQGKLDAVAVFENEVETAQSLLKRVRSRVENPLDATTVRLFQDAGQLKKLLDAATTQPISARAGSKSASHQLVDPTASVLGSIRLLAETARGFHDGPTSLDPNGWNNSASNARLFKAVRTVAGHILMLSLNEHYSEENVIRLRAEIAMHGLNLDAYEGRIKEAGFRLDLTDIQAFHRSGITDADIKTIYGTAESIILGLISSK